MDQGIDRAGNVESRPLHPFTVLTRTVGPSLREGEQGGRIKRDRQGAVQVIIEKDIVNRQTPALAQLSRVVVYEGFAGGLIPVVENVGQENKLGSSLDFMPEHVSLTELDPIGYPVLRGELTRYR